MAKCSAWPLLGVFSLLVLRAWSQELNLEDALTNIDLMTPKPTVAGGGRGREETAGLDGKLTIKPSVQVTTKTTAKPKSNSGDLDLEDALNPKNDPKENEKNSNGGQFTDDDLLDAADKTPNKGRDSAKSAENNDAIPEVGTIAGIVSAVAMALVGAVTSYISYQKKKLCFSIQQSLNAEVMKGENPEAVVSQEPQVQQTLLDPPNAEPAQE